MARLYHKGETFRLGRCGVMRDAPFKALPGRACDRFLAGLEIVGLHRMRLRRDMSGAGLQAVVRRTAQQGRAHHGTE